MQLTDEQRARGVIASSAGNHSQGLSYHGTRLGVPVTIVMPRTTPSVKIMQTESVGGRVVREGETFDDAYAHARKLETELGLTFVHPFDDPHVAAGAGTVALEMLADAPQIEQLAVRLASLNPTAPLLQSSKGSIAAADIIDVGLYDPSDKAPDVATWLSEAKVSEQASLRRLSYGKHAPIAPRTPVHNSEVESFVITFDAPLAWGGVSTTLDTLLQGHGEQILRIKGLMNIQGEPGPRIVQCVQHTRYPSVRLPEWPDDAAYADRKSRLVFITRNLSEARLRESLAHIKQLIQKYGASPDANSN